MERKLINMTTTKKMTIVNRYSRSVNMNSFAPFSLVGESATLPAYKGGRLLMQVEARAVSDSRPPSPHRLRLRATCACAPAHTYRENGHFHEPAGTFDAREIFYTNCYRDGSHFIIIAAHKCLVRQKVFIAYLLSYFIIQ